MIQSERLTLVPFEINYLNDYFTGFNAEITRFQWPEPFESVEDARSVLQGFLDEMAQGETLLFSVLSESGEFLGSVEVHGLTGDCPELGVWITEAAQGRGYAYEALNAVLDHVRAHYHKDAFYYEADVRNTGSIRLLRKFADKYEILEQELERLTTDAGKELALQGHILQAR